MADDQVEPSPEIHFEPVVNLPLVETKTCEEDEDVLFQMRAKLYRYDDTSVPPEWKERGTGDIKILKHRTNCDVRIVMRREKTFKLCANHSIQPYMVLKPNITSEKAWIWSTYADFADGKPTPELFAVKFQNAECAQKFKAAFDKAKKYCYTKSLNDSGDVCNSSILTSSDSESDLNRTTDGETDTSRNEDTDNSKIEESTDTDGALKENTGEDKESEVAEKLENLSLKKDDVEKTNANNIKNNETE